MKEKLCDTCRHRNNVEQLKPCIIYRDDCEYYEKDRGDMTNGQVKAEIMQIYGVLSPSKQQALDMAIKALEQEPKTGHWIEVTNGRGGHECNICHEYAPSYQDGDEYLAKYCPNCGAKMVEPQESEVQE